MRAIAVAAAAASAPRSLAQNPPGRGSRFPFALVAHAGPPSTGMVYVAIGRDNQRTPIEQAGPTGAPLFSKYVEQLAPGRWRRSGRRSRASDREPARPARRRYWVQPFVNVYTRFPRADGHTVWMHMDQWEGQNWKRSPGNLFGEPEKVTDRSRVADADHARRRQSDSADRGSRGHRARQAHQDSKPDSDEVVGPSDLSRRHGAPAEGLRRASGHPLPGELRGRTFLARARRVASAAAARWRSCGSRPTRRASSTSRSSIRRRTTTIRTA